MFMYTEKILQYGLYACIGITVLCVSLALYFWYKDRKLKRENNKEVGVVYDEETTKQDTINREYVAQIISGNHKKVTLVEQKENNTAFARWQKKQKELFVKVSREVLSWRAKLIKDNNLKVCRPAKITNQSVDLSGKAKIFSDIFTEPFPSFHDMDDHAVLTQFTDLVILNECSPSEAQDCVVVITQHFVNHNMKKGIIRFDVYK